MFSAQITGHEGAAFPRAVMEQAGFAPPPQAALSPPQAAHHCLQGSGGVPPLNHISPRKDEPLSSVPTSAAEAGQALQVEVY